MKKGLLRFHSERSSTFGLEMHLALLHQAVGDFQPRVVDIDPISNLSISTTEVEIKGMLSRVIDFLKMQKITAIPTLIRRLPPPLKKIVGNLSKTERVLVGLDLKPRAK